MYNTLKYTAVLIGLLAVGGCATPDLAPSQVRGDRFTAQHVVFSGQDNLSDDIAFGEITRTCDAGGILHVTVPARNTTPSDIPIDYRFIYFDENHNPIDLPTAWQTQTLHSNIFEYVQGNASTPRARDFQIDIRNAQ